MKNKTILLSIMFVTVLGIQVNAQFAKYFNKVRKDISENTLNEWHKQHKGQVLFYNKSIKYKSSSENDSKRKLISERAIAGNGPFSFRAYLEKPYNKYKGNGFDIRYTMGGESITTEELREELPQYYSRMASNYSYYDSDNQTIGVALNSGSGKYYDMYTLQEDAYRILLSKIKSKLTLGANLPLKVEIIGTERGKPNGEVLASGKINMKVTSESNNLQSLNCRCGKPGLKDSKIINEVKSAFEFQFNDVKKVHEVIMLSREFTENFDNSYPVKNVVSKGMWANIVYEKTDGIFMMVKRYVFFKKIGNSFSKKATIGKHEFHLPISPTCVNQS